MCNFTLSCCTKGRQCVRIVIVNILILFLSKLILFLQVLFTPFRIFSETEAVEGEGESRRLRTVWELIARALGKWLKVQDGLRKQCTDVEGQPLESTGGTFVLVSSLRDGGCSRKRSDSRQVS